MVKRKNRFIFKYFISLNKLKVLNNVILKANFELTLL